VPGPTRVSVMTSCAAAIESSFLGASLPKGSGKQNTAPDRQAHRFISVRVFRG
jgi:hypothetical protein